MKKDTPTFASILKQFGYHYDLRTVFNDFLTMSLCSFSQNPETGKSYDEDLYLETIAKYKDDKLRFEFPNMLACLITEMTERQHTTEGNDVLGECYEENFSRKSTSQFFTPWSVCKLMAQLACDTRPERIDAPLRIMDPTCGSGRTVLASAPIYGPNQEYYGIDIDETCVKMAAINFFLNGLFHSEVMCADALMPDDFRVSYKISFLPFGVFRITDKDRSPLWHLQQDCWEKQPVKLQQEPPEFTATVVDAGNQLTFF